MQSRSRAGGLSGQLYGCLLFRRIYNTLTFSQRIQQQTHSTFILATFPLPLFSVMCHDPKETEELLSNLIQFDLRSVYLLASMHGPELIMHIIGVCCISYQFWEFLGKRKSRLRPSQLVVWRIKDLWEVSIYWSYSFATLY